MAKLFKSKWCAWGGTQIAKWETNKFSLIGNLWHGDIIDCPQCSKSVKLRIGLQNPLSYAMIPRHKTK